MTVRLTGCPKSFASPIFCALASPIALYPAGWLLLPLLTIIDRGSGLVPSLNQVQAHAILIQCGSTHEVMSYQ